MNYYELLLSSNLIDSSLRWRDASLMLNKHSKILEFLEIIQLLDSCLRNAHYDEALKLLNYISKLNAKHGKHIPLIAVSSIMELPLYILECV